MTPLHPSVLSYRDPYVGRVLMPVRRLQHAATVQKIARVAASLQRLDVAPREAASTKQETPDPARSEASTAHHPSPPEVRAAGAQSDTRT